MLCSIIPSFPQVFIFLGYLVCQNMLIVQCHRESILPGNLASPSKISLGIWHHSRECGTLLNPRELCTPTPNFPGNHAPPIIFLVNQDHVATLCLKNHMKVCISMQNYLKKKNCVGYARSSIKSVSLISKK